MDSICIFLRINELQASFHVLLLHIFEEASIQVLACFLIGLFVFLLLSLGLPYMFWILNPYQICDLQVASHSLGHFFTVFSQRMMSFDARKV